MKEKRAVYVGPTFQIKNGFVFMNFGMTGYFYPDKDFMPCGAKAGEFIFDGIDLSSVWVPVSDVYFIDP